MDRLELRHVRAFLCVARHLHFARAADELDIAPPALTRLVQDAERLLGVRLFHRTRRSVALSAAGAAYLGEAQAALAHLARGRERAALAERGEIGRIELGYVSSAAYAGVLQRTVGAFRDAHPRIRVDVREVPMSEVAARLDAGTLDAAYVRPPLPLPLPDGVSTHTVHRDVFVVAVHGQSPLAARASIRPAALAGERFVVPEQALGTLEAARRGRFEPIVDARPGALVAVLAHVSVSGGVAIVPKALVGCVSLPGVAYRPIEGKPIASEVAVAYRRHEKAPAVRAFVRQAAL
ncbi:LysR family transcriptional regulator [Burkholderia pseudomallei]|uniref:LysR family transcriptional regulator n=1 Tax=Burkholderia pseudomallei TaxID=28450 RepID=UPI000975C493|nr:LysR family transcriptional regulator [Burkholderia pseudomallei]MCV9913558.1 LysR substrate-binding domain-containing protein [Burkholderia pseudomallei]MCV9972142.1 LysR substrate-binding domain-containing protein [Burkholderia pseudomallei]MCW0071679.1 LysR substrate-binding domain-containing protein [Burkholderia pseudomallei]OND85110.1 LysR family transcriptional regulator [Burkholderia pseudomallei]OND90722.1 LysR family transcriptional regulator [Burkholderia pseudomallei]